MTRNENILISEIVRLLRLMGTKMLHRLYILALNML